MAERENGLLLGYIVGCGIAGATCLAIFYKIFTLFLKDDRPTLQEAIDGNSLAPK